MIRVLFFASLRERLGKESVEIPYRQGISVREIKQNLVMENPAWEQDLLAADTLSAVNQDVQNCEYELNAGDEVAFFPPVTGG